MSSPEIQGYMAGGVEFLDPAQHRPPRGAKILLLTPGGVCVVGHWDNWFVAWHPLPTVPAHLKWVPPHGVDVSGPIIEEGYEAGCVSRG